MVPWRATEDGFVTPHVLAWYERFARLDTDARAGVALSADGKRRLTAPDWPPRPPGRPRRWGLLKITGNRYTLLRGFSE
jgi:hypothetical protein